MIREYHKMLAYAVANLGVCEVPAGSNNGAKLRDVLHGTDYKPSQQWCVNMLQAIWLAGGVHQGSLSVWWNTTSSCHELLQLARDRDRVLKWPASGCCALVDSPDRGVYHCVWVMAIEPDAQYVWTVEGNGNVRGSANGGMVCALRRHVSSLIFIQP